MRPYYGILLPTYWTGQTGRGIRARGGKDAQLLGAYLLSNEHANMIGLYRLTTADIRSDLQFTSKAICTAFDALSQESFAFYDADARIVWVREMARIRLQIIDEAPLDRKDKRRIGAEKLYLASPSNAFLGWFFDRYSKVLHLKSRREASPRAVGDHPLQAIAPAPAAVPPDVGLPSPIRSASHDVRRGFEGASKPGSGSVQQDQGSEDQEIRKEKSSGADAPPSARPKPPANPNDNIRLITKFAHEAIDLVGPHSGDLSEAVKSLCASRHVAYDSGVVRAAIDSARHQRRALQT